MRIMLSILATMLLLEVSAQDCVNSILCHYVDKTLCTTVPTVRNKCRKMCGVWETENFRSWSGWNTWTRCGCRGGTRVRRRSCVNGFTGDPGCVGPAYETEPCENRNCPYWSNWGEWCGCSASCNGGTQTRTRICVNGRVSYPGCEGVSTAMEFCNSQPCPTWTPWSEFGPCTATCGGGIQSKHRKCVGGDPGMNRCNGPAVARNPCAEQNCPYWSSWGEWSGCSASCNGGTQTRRRFCVNGMVGDPGCFGDPTGMEFCNSQNCPYWSSWGEWSCCTASCNGGAQTRTRICVNGMVGDYGCDGDPTGMEICNSQECPSYGAWTVLDDESCSATCGGGVLRRFRVCLNAQSQQECSVLGPERDATPCGTDECP